MEIKLKSIRLYTQILIAVISVSCPNPTVFSVKEDKTSMLGKQKERLPRVSSTYFILPTLFLP